VLLGPGEVIGVDVHGGYSEHCVFKPMRFKICATNSILLFAMIMRKNGGQQRAVRVVNMWTGYLLDYIYI
jgi:hypothetical protein